MSAQTQVGAKDVTDFLDKFGVGTAVLLVAIGTGIWCLKIMLPAWRDTEVSKQRAWERIAQAHENLPAMHAKTHSALEAMQSTLEDFRDEMRAALRK